MADASVSPNSPMDAIPYTRLFPWLKLFRCAGLASEPKALMLATAGLVMTFLGQILLSPISPEIGHGAMENLIESPTRARVPLSLVAEPYAGLSSPLFRDMKTGEIVPAGWTTLLCTAWPILVWALVGGAIARMGVARLAKEERIGLLEAVGFSFSKWQSLLGSLLVPVLGVVVLAVPLALFGLLYRIGTEAGPSVAGALAILPLIGGLVMAVVVLAPVLGWPITIASVAAEDEDAFDAISRTYAYLHQRPWEYAAYVVIAGLIGIAGLTFVGYFANLVLGLTVWGLSLSGPPDKIQAFFSPTRLSAPDTLPTAFSAHWFWLAAFFMVVKSWAYSFFWTIAPAIYLLLRKSIDGTPISTFARRQRPAAKVEPSQDPEAQT